ncbi:MAG: gephyrin-like molybdotransferase Glp [Nitrospirota bacterium]
MKDMLGREELILVESALERLFGAAPFHRTREIFVPLEQAYGVVTSRDIISPEDLPAFSRSTVDGYAVNSTDTFGATDSLPACLSMKAEILMGEKPEFHLNKGEAAGIATGGMLPPGADAVVMFEHTQKIDEKMIEIVKPASPGENVIQAGEDSQKGAIVLRSGQRLRPQDVGALAGLGITEVPVLERPRISIVSTGDEIVPADEQVNPGQVRDINSYVLSGLILAAGGIPLKKGIFKDRYEVIRSVVERSLEDSEMILISGGSSVGAKDMTAKVINDIGKPGVLFHGVSMKPGKPLIGGVVDGRPIFGLPGHPVAVHICFEIFVRPILESIAGLRAKGIVDGTRTVKARIGKNISSSPGREEHIGVILEERAGELWAVPVLGKSGLITNLTLADGTAVIPLRKFGVHEGEIVEIRLF